MTARARKPTGATRDKVSTASKSKVPSKGKVARKRAPKAEAVRKPSQKAEATRKPSQRPGATHERAPEGKAAGKSARKDPAAAKTKAARESRHTAAVPALPPDAMTAEQIARVLQEMAALLEILGENPFKVRAYENAARLVPGLGEELPALVQNGELEKVRGIGKGIAERIATLARTGSLEDHDLMRSKVPPGLLDMLRIPGLGPKKVKLLYDALDIDSIDALEQACRQDKLLGTKGLGEKTQENILQGIELVRRREARFFWSVAAEHAKPAYDELLRHPAVQRAQLAGSLRRRKESVHDVDIVVSTGDPEAVTRSFVSGPWVDRVLGSGATKTSILHPSGLQIDLRVVTDEQFPYALHHFTGSKEHNIAMRGRAVRMGIKINEYGLFRGTELVPCRDEAEIFEALGLQFVPPELREDSGEIEAAENGAIPQALLEEGHLRGAFHMHTTFSDGQDSLHDVVRAARDLGWEYLGISDHSMGAPEKGMSPEKAREQLEALAQVASEERGIRVFRGIEAEILPDGSLDYPEDLLERFDFVIASVHQELHLEREAQTRRVVRAVQNPFTTILGHPTSRLLFDEPGMDLDLSVVFEAAAKHGVVVEINGQPKRMDPDAAHIRLAREHGAMLCVNPDAHRIGGLRNLQYGVGLARRGWLEKEHVINTWDAKRMGTFLQAQRERATKARS